MCGKFTAKASWTGIVDAAWSDAPVDEDRILTYRVMGNVPVIVRSDAGRCVVPMRWGFPHPKDWKRPQPIHAPGRDHRQRAGLCGGLSRRPARHRDSAELQ